MEQRVIFRRESDKCALIMTLLYYKQYFFYYLLIFDNLQALNCS